MKSVFEMSGTERAAALLVALGPKVAADIMKHLDEESIERLSVEMAKIDRLTPQEREELIGEFLIDLKKEKRRLRGGEGAAREILTKTIGPEKAEAIIERFSGLDIDKECVALNEIEDDALRAILEQESPQAVAMVLSFLAPEKAASVLKGLTQDRAKEVAIRLAKMDRVVPEAVVGVIKAIKKKYQDYRQKHQGLSAGGLDTLAGILRHLPPDDEQKILKELESELPEVSRQIGEKIFTFDMVKNLTNTEIRILIDAIGDDRLIAMALKGADDDIRFKFLRNMSQNRATDVLRDMETMGAVRRSEVEECRSQIVSIVRSLAERGAVRLTDSGTVWVK